MPQTNAAPAKRKPGKPTAVTTEPAAPRLPNLVRAGKAGKLSFKEKKELESLPAHIEALEAEQARLQNESASSAFYKESAAHIKGVLARIDAIAQDLETVLARWVALESAAADLARRARLRARAGVSFPFRSPLPALFPPEV